MNTTQEQPYYGRLALYLPKPKPRREVKHIDELKAEPKIKKDDTKMKASFKVIKRETEIDGVVYTEKIFIRLESKYDKMMRKLARRPS